MIFWGTNKIMEDNKQFYTERGLDWLGFYFVGSAYPFDSCSRYLSLLSTYIQGIHFVYYRLPVRQIIQLFFSEAKVIGME